MTSTMRRCVRSILLVSIVAGLAGVPPAAAQIKNAPSLDGLEQLMLQLRNQLKNTSARLKNGVVGATEDGAGAGGAQTPATSCCNANLRRMRAVMRDMDAVVSKLGRDYTKLGLKEGTEHAKQLGGEIATLQAGFDVFESAGSAELVQSALDGLTRAYIGLRETADELASCCAPAPTKDKKRAKG